MSVETKAALDAAIEAHVLDETDGDHAGAYVLVLERMSFNTEYEQGSVLVFTRSGQSPIMTLGLINSCTMIGESE